MSLLRIGVINKCLQKASATSSATVNRIIANLRALQAATVAPAASITPRAIQPPAAIAAATVALAASITPRTIQPPAAIADAIVVPAASITPPTIAVQPTAPIDLGDNQGLTQGDDEAPVASDDKDSEEASVASFDGIDDEEPVTEETAILGDNNGTPVNQPDAAAPESMVIQPPPVNQPGADAAAPQPMVNQPAVNQPNAPPMIQGGSNYEAEDEAEAQPEARPKRKHSGTVYSRAISQYSFMEGQVRKSKRKCLGNDATHRKQEQMYLAAVPYKKGGTGGLFQFGKGWFADGYIDCTMGVPK